MKIPTFFKAIPETGFYRSKSWLIVLVLFVFLGAAVQPRASSTGRAAFIQAVDGARQ